MILVLSIAVKYHRLPRSTILFSTDDGNSHLNHQSYETQPEVESDLQTEVSRLKKSETAGQSNKSYPGNPNET